MIYRIDIENLHTCTYMYMYVDEIKPPAKVSRVDFGGIKQHSLIHMGWQRLVGSIKLQVSFAKEPYKRGDILQKKPKFWRSLLIVATPYHICESYHTCKSCHVSHIWVMSHPRSSPPSPETKNYKSMWHIWVVTQMRVLWQDFVKYVPWQVVWLI